MSLTSQVPDAGTPIFDAAGYINPVWHEFFFTLLRRTGGTAGDLVTDVGADLPITSTHGSTPVIGINPATDALAGSMSGSDKAKLDTVVAGAAVASVSGVTPIASTGGANPAISISPATGSAAGSFSAADKSKLDTVVGGAAVASVSGAAPLSSTGGGNPILSIAAATTTTPGSMSAVDKLKLDGIAGGIGSGYIDGLTMVYTGRTTLTVRAGSAFVPSSGTIITLAADKVFSTLTLAASAFHHVYLYLNGSVGDIEVTSAAGPINYFNTAFQKTGDATRRYIGSFLTNASSQIFAFRHDPQRSLMRYIEGNPGTAPFTLLSSATATTATVVNTSSVVGPTGHTVTVGSSVLGATTYLNLFVAEQPTVPAGGTWQTVVGPGISPGLQLPIEIVLSQVTATIRQFIYFMTGGGSASMYATGYYFNR